MENSMQSIELDNYDRQNTLDQKKQKEVEVVVDDSDDNDRELTCWEKFKQYLSMAQLLSFSTNMNIMSSKENFEYTFKWESLTAYIIFIIFIIAVLFATIEPFGLIGSIKLNLNYQDANLKYIKVDLHDPDHFPLFFQLRWKEHPAFNSTDVCKYFSQKEFTDNFQLYQEYNKQKLENTTADFKCMSDPDKKDRAIFRFMFPFEKYYKFEQGRIYKIELNLTNSLTIFNGDQVSLYAYSSLQSIMKNADVKDEDKFMSKLATYRFNAASISNTNPNQGLYSINAQTVEENSENYYDKTGAWEKFKYIILGPIKQNVTKDQKLTMDIYEDARSYFIGDDYNGLKFDLKLLFKVKASKVIYYQFTDFISAVGGSFSTYTLVFITIPAALFIDRAFLQFITKHIWKARTKDGKKDEDIDEDTVRERYLTRVSHEGIYNLYDDLKEVKEETQTLKEENERQKREIKMLWQKIDDLQKMVQNQQ